LVNFKQNCTTQNKESLSEDEEKSLKSERHKVLSNRTLPYCREYRKNFFNGGNLKALREKGMGGGEGAVESMGGNGAYTKLTFHITTLCSEPKKGTDLMQERSLQRA